MRARPTPPLAIVLTLGLGALVFGAAGPTAPAAVHAQPTAPADSAVVDAAPADSTAAIEATAAVDTTAAEAMAATSDTAAAAASAAAVDSLNIYWRDLDVDWYQPLTSGMLAPVVAPAMLDSLTRAGDAELARVLAGHLWRFSVSPLGRLDVNRCEGLRPGVALRARHMVRHGASLELGLGYGIAREKFVWDAALTAPSAIAMPPRDADPRAERAPRAPWPRLTWEVAFADRVQYFAGLQTVMAFMDRLSTGNDHLYYYRLQSARAGVTWKPRPALDVRLGGLIEQHRPLPVATRWSLEGDRSRVGPNLAVEKVDLRGLGFGLGGTSRRLTARMDFTALWWDESVLFAPPEWLPSRSGDDGSGPDLTRFEASARGLWIDARGHELELRAACHAASRQEPVESRSWLGGYGTLRGFPEGEVVGDQAAWVSADLRLGWDPLRALRVPLLGRLGLQPLAFADWGTTRRMHGRFQEYGADGERADVGLGLGKVLLGGGVGGYLRLFAAKPVGYGQGDRDWLFSLEVEM